MFKWILLLVISLAAWKFSDAKVCQDKVSDCGRAISHCPLGGVGATVRANCMLSCGICTSSSTASVIATPRNAHRPPRGSSGGQKHGRPTRGRPRTRSKPRVNQRPKPRTPSKPQTPKTNPVSHPNHKKPIGPNQIIHNPGHKAPINQHPKTAIHPNPHNNHPNPQVNQQNPKPVVTKPIPPPTTKAPEIQNPLFKKSLDESVKPCDDFYNFACRSYIKSHPTTEDHWVAEEVQQQLIRQRQIKAITDNTPTGSPAIRNMRLYRDKCMVTAPIETLKTQNLARDINEYGNCPMYDPTWQVGTKTFTSLFGVLAKLTSRHFLFDMSVRRHDDGKYMLYLHPEPLIMEEPEKYFLPEHQNDVKALEQFLTEVLTLVAQDNNWPIRTLAQDIKDIMDYDKKRAEAYAKHGYTAQRKARSKQMDKVLFTELSRPDIFSIVDWDKYISDDPLFTDEMKAKIRSPGFEVLIYNKKLFNDLQQGITGTPWTVGANYYATRLILDSLPYLDSRFQAIWNKYKVTVNGRSGRATQEEECVDSVVELFPLLNDYLYMQSHFNPQNETVFTETLKMKEGVQQLLQKQTWLDQPTKDFAAKKLLNAQVNMGGVAEAKLIMYLDNVYGSYVMDATDSFRQSYVKLKQIMRRQTLVDSPQNGPMYELRSTEIDDLYYRYSQNTAYLPASLINPSFYDTTLPKAYNYGSIGTMISRQYMRGFDTTGFLYNEYGLKNYALSPTMQTEFSRRTKLLQDQYSALVEPQTSKNVKGDKTIDENILDNSAIKASFLAYKEDLKKQGTSTETAHVSGYSKYTPEQIFYIAYGMSMCSAVTKDYMEHLINEGDFSPKVFRVNTVLQNDPNFASTFKCQSGDKMNPTSRVEVY